MHHLYNIIIIHFLIQEVLPVGEVAHVSPHSFYSLSLSDQGQASDLNLHGVYHHNSTTNFWWPPLVKLQCFISSCDYWCWDIDKQKKKKIIWAPSKKEVEIYSVSIKHGSHISPVNYWDHINSKNCVHTCSSILEQFDVVLVHSWHDNVYSWLGGAEMFCEGQKNRRWRDQQQLW